MTEPNLQDLFVQAQSLKSTDPAAAETLFKTILTIDPFYPGANPTLGSMLIHLNKNDEALHYFFHELQTSTNVPQILFNVGLAYLTSGNFEDGWVYYEWRTRMITDSTPIPFGYQQLLWDGKHTKHLFLFTEQGLGDCLHMSGYLERISRTVNVATVLVKPPLKRLLEKSFKHLSNIDFIDDVTGATSLSYTKHLPLMSLPRAFGQKLCDLPVAQNYLIADDKIAAKWKKKLSAFRGKKIGLQWAGNADHTYDHRRSVDPNLLMTLAIDGIDFFTLRKGEETEFSNKPLIPVHDFSHEIEDFADLAGLIANLDLVISIDTAVIHLAAGMGKPVWLLNRYDTDWRWLTDRDDSPWYPSVRIFRQSRFGDWTSVIARVSAELKKIAEQ